MPRAIHRTKADETPEFKTFWEEIWLDIMNPNDGRGSARDEFFRHVDEGADPQDIVDGARWFRFNGGNKEFKQHASTWLNKRAYEDGAMLWRKHVAGISERSNVVNISEAPRAKSKWLQDYESKAG